MENQKPQVEQVQESSKYVRYYYLSIAWSFLLVPFALLVYTDAFDFSIVKYFFLTPIIFFVYILMRLFK